MVRVSAFLIAAVAAVLVGAAGAESLSLSAETDKDPLSYRVGEEMAFTFTVVDRAAKNAPVKGRRVAWTRTGDDGLAEVGEALSDPAVVVRTKIDRPGFVRLQAHVVDADGKVIPGSGSFDGSAGADVMRIPAKLLFLGCGFKGTVPAHVERFSSEFCDCLYWVRFS